MRPLDLKIFGEISFMKISDEKEIFTTRKLKKDLIFYLLVYLCFGLQGPLILVWQISRAPADLQLPSVEFFISPVLSTFAIGLLISLTIGKLVTSPLVRKFKDQHVSQGVVLDNSTSILGHLGFNLGMGVLLGISFVGKIICNILVTVNDQTAILFCQTIVSTVSALFVGVAIGLSFWVISQVVFLERETNQHMMVQYYSTKQWSWVMIIAGGVIIYIIGRTFYKIATLS